MESERKWIVLYALAGVIAIALHYTLNLEFFSKWPAILPYLSELTISLFMICMVLLVKTISISLIKTKVSNPGDQHNLLRVTKLIATSFLVVIIILTILQKTAASLYSVGIASLVLGFALQAPITSFIGWLYIIFRHPYQAGDRISIKGHRGDVVEISYLDTTIMECSGVYLGNDRRSGRLIKIPNSTILSQEVINYSGDQTPFIWNETAVQIAYTSDLKFVEECLLKVAQEDFEKQYPNLLETNTQWLPDVYYRVNTYSWLEAVISYPSEPFDTTRKRNQILRDALPLLNMHPDKVQFPDGTKR